MPVSSCMRFISARETSLAMTTRVTPNCERKRTPSAPVTVICVLVCISIDGDSSSALATTSLLLHFTLEPVAYRSREILDIPASDISSIRIDTPTQTRRLIRDASTGQWSPAAPWMDRLLSTLTPLRAQSLVATEPPDAGFEKPFLSLTLLLRGQSGLATTLLIGNEISPAGPRWATVRGRDLVFTLSPLTVESLQPPPAQDPS